METNHAIDTYDCAQAQYNLNFSLESTWDQAEIASIWRRLERKSSPSVFLSWSWISAWLESVKPQAHLLVARHENLIVGLAFVVFRRQRVARFLSSQAFYIHQTGDPNDDQIWPEYNSILVDPPYRDIVLKESIHFLKNTSFKPDELRLGATLSRDVELLTPHFDHRHDRWVSPAYGVDLEFLRTHKQAYLASLSRNTRSQINRSFRLYEEQEGALTLHKASNKAEALDLFGQLKPLHLERWGAQLGQSGFANPVFEEFHLNLIDKGWDEGVIDFVSLYAGNKCLGIFYNFKYCGTVYFYMSGLIKEGNAKLKPGLCGHTLMIDHYLSLGAKFYDFMGGTERYKQSLGCQHSTLYQSYYRWGTIGFDIERLARYFKSRLRFH